MEEEGRGGGGEGRGGGRGGKWRRERLVWEHYLTCIHNHANYSGSVSHDTAP